MESICLGYGPTNIQLVRPDWPNMLKHMAAKCRLKIPELESRSLRNQISALGKSFSYRLSYFVVSISVYICSSFFHGFICFPYFPISNIFHILGPLQKYGKYGNQYGCRHLRQRSSKPSVFRLSKFFFF